MHSEIQFTTRNVAVEKRDTRTQKISNINSSIIYSNFHSTYSFTRDQQSYLPSQNSRLTTVVFKDNIFLLQQTLEIPTNHLRLEKQNDSDIFPRGFVIIRQTIQHVIHAYHSQQITSLLCHVYI